MGAFLASDGFESVNLNAIRKEGYLYKQSRHVGTWRLRLLVLHQQYLCTFARSQHYTHPTEQIDLRQFKTLTSPLFDSSISAFIITLQSSTPGSSFSFKHSDEQLIHEWHEAIQHAIHASNDNLICGMLSAEILTGPIACYLVGYQRFQNLPCVNRRFAQLFRLHTFDFAGVYLSDGCYFLQHFYRFYNATEHCIAIKQGLYRCMYNPHQEYDDIYVDARERKQLLYLLMAYGALLKGALTHHRQQLQLQPHAHNRHDPRRHTGRGLATLVADMQKKESLSSSRVDYEEDHDREETKDDDTKDYYDNNPMRMSKEDDCKAHRQHELPLECVDYFNRKCVKHAVEIPPGVTVFDFSRHLSHKTKLVALSFHELRDDDGEHAQHGEHCMMDASELKEINSLSSNDTLHGQGSYGPRLPLDVQWICDLLTYAHVATFEQIQVLDLSHNAWSNTDVMAICDAIMSRQRTLSLKQLKLDGIPLVTEIDACKTRAVKRLFAAIRSKCHALQLLSLNHCMLRDDTCQVIRTFYAQNPRTTLRTIYLINNNLTERGVDSLNEVAPPLPLAFVVGSFYRECASEWNASIITSDQYSPICI